MIVSLAGYADAPSLGQRLHPGGNIDSIAVNAAVFCDDITQVDADTKFHLAVIRQLGISFCKLPLDFYSRVDGIDHAGKLCKDIVAGRIHNSPSELLGKVGYGITVSGKCADGGRFIMIAANNLAPMTPIEHVVALYEATKEFGRYE